MTYKFREKMAARWPFWIRSKFWKHVHHQKIGGYLNTKFQGYQSSHLWELGDDIQISGKNGQIFGKNGCQVAILNQIKISKIGHHLWAWCYLNTKFQVNRSSHLWDLGDDRQILGKNGQISGKRGPLGGHFESEQNFKNNGIICGMGFIWISNFK